MSENRSPNLQSSVVLDVSTLMSQDDDDGLNQPTDDSFAYRHDVEYVENQGHDEGEDSDTEMEVDKNPEVLPPTCELPQAEHIESLGCCANQWVSFVCANSYNY